MEESLISAVDALLDYVASHKDTILHAEVPELLALDQDVETFCQVTGFSLPASCGANYGNNVIGFCRLPAVRHSGGVKVIQDPGWLLAMRGLRKMAELRNEPQHLQTVATRPLVDELALTDRQYAVLDALFDMKSFTPDQKMSTDEIAAKAGDRGPDPAGFKEPIADLGRHGLVKTKTGRGGGCWLSRDGRRFTEQLRKQ